MLSGPGPEVEHTPRRPERTGEKRPLALDPFGPGHEAAVVHSRIRIVRHHRILVSCFGVTILDTPGARRAVPPFVFSVTQLDNSARYRTGS